MGTAPIRERLAALTPPDDGTKCMTGGLIGSVLGNVGTDAPLELRVTGGGRGTMISLL